MNKIALNAMDRHGFLTDVSREARRGIIGKNSEMFRDVFPNGVKKGKTLADIKAGAAAKLGR